MRLELCFECWRSVQGLIEGELMEKTRRRFSFITAGLVLRENLNETENKLTLLVINPSLFLSLLALWCNTNIHSKIGSGASRGACCSAESESHPWVAVTGCPCDIWGQMMKKMNLHPCMNLK